MKPNDQLPDAAHAHGERHQHGPHIGHAHRHAHHAPDAPQSPHATHGDPPHHGHHHARGPLPVAPRSSLLMSSAVYRMAAATVLSALLWAAVAWALSGSP